jgi:hypothetical protein
MVCVGDDATRMTLTALAACQTAVAPASGPSGDDAVHRAGALGARLALLKGGVTNLASVFGVRFHCAGPKLIAGAASGGAGAPVAVRVENAVLGTPVVVARCGRGECRAGLAAALGGDSDSTNTPLGSGGSLSAALGAVAPCVPRGDHAVDRAAVGRAALTTAKCGAFLSAEGLLCDDRPLSASGSTATSL